VKNERLDLEKKRRGKMDVIKLVKKAKKGNDAAFEELIFLYQDQLYRTAFLYVQNKEDALDVVQEAVYKAYIAIGQLKNPEFFMTWLTRILINCANEVLRVKKKMLTLFEEKKIKTNDKMVDKATQTEQNIDLREAINQLDENFQTAIILYYFHDLSIQQISEQMEIPEGTVKTHLHRARKLLKKYIEGSDHTWMNNGLQAR
jgi:RNA polymerase sigma-70 factor (ECF subfamily)